MTSPRSPRICVIVLLTLGLCGAACATGSTASELTSALERRDVDPAFVRMLLATGIPTSALDNRALSAALRSSDPGLVVDMLDHGAVIHEGGQASVTEDVTAPFPLLVQAMWARQTTLLPRLLRAGANPNVRRAGGYSAVEWAIKLGDQEALDVLLAHGGRIEVAEPGHSISAASTLDLAVASANTAMLDRIRSLWPGDLSRACLNNPWQLVHAVLDTTNAYWESLLAQGLGQPNRESRDTDPCTEQPPLAVRLVSALLGPDEGIQVGWRDARLTARLKDLWQPAVTSGQLTRPESAQWLSKARDEGRDDVVRALLHAGVSEAPAAGKPGNAGPNIPGKPSARDKALAEQLPGHYYMTGLPEVGSEILLDANGRFKFGLVYGGEDQQAAGTWTVRDSRILFRTSRPAPDVTAVPFKRLKGRPLAVGATPGAVSVRAVIRERDLLDTNVTVMGCDAPNMARGRTRDHGWQGGVPGALCQIVLQHPQIDRGRPFVYEVPDDEATASRGFVFEVQLPDQPTGIDFNVDMQIENKKLLWDRRGSLLTYERR